MSPFVCSSGLLLQESNKFSEALYYYKLAIGSRPTLACKYSSSFLLTISSSCGCGCAVSRQQCIQAVVMWRERNRWQRAVGIQLNSTFNAAVWLAFKADSCQQIRQLHDVIYYEFRPWRSYFISSLLRSLLLLLSLSFWLPILHHPTMRISHNLTAFAGIKFSIVSRLIRTNRSQSYLIMQ